MKGNILFPPQTPITILKSENYKPSSTPVKHKFMDNIDITKALEDFYHHLNETSIDRTIFSARFGDGKTEFLKQFKEKYQNEYDFYTLYPVNYQIAPNEQIMEYIKILLSGKPFPHIKVKG